MVDSPTPGTDENNAGTTSKNGKPIVPVGLPEAKPEKISPAQGKAQTGKESDPIEWVKSWWHSPNRRWNKPRGERAKWTDKAIVVLTGGIVFLAFMQWLEMHESGKQTDRIIEADQRIATAMEGAVSQATQSLSATIEQFHLEQRAWIGPTEAAPPKYREGDSLVYIKQGEKTQFGFLLTNSGKTPAMKFMSKVASTVLPADSKFLPKYEKVRNLPTVGVLQPGVKMPLETLPSTGVATKEQIDILKSGKMVFYIFGDVKYEDVFGVPHTTTFCVFVKPNLSELSSCNTYNEAN